jgi:Fuc2NAc and GlcNAc transferase
MLGIAGRLIVHTVAALWATSCLGRFAEIRFGEEVIQLGYAGTALAVLGIVWALNLFNLKDGIDGIAASQAVFMAAGDVVLARNASLSLATPEVGFTIAAACRGILWWNRSAARTFMGDVGCGYLGFVLAVVGFGAQFVNVASCCRSGWSWVASSWLMPRGALTRRLICPERLYEAHRSHAY